MSKKDNSGFYILYGQCQGSYKSEHTECITRVAGDKRNGRGKHKTVGNRHEEICGRGEGWGGEHGVYKMDTTGTFRKESRE